MTRESGYIGNKNAVKQQEIKAESILNIRCKTADKAAWVRAAKKEESKLTEWVIKNLNASLADK